MSVSLEKDSPTGTSDMKASQMTAPVLLHPGRRREIPHQREKITRTGKDWLMGGRELSWLPGETKLLPLSFHQGRMSQVTSSPAETAQVHGLGAS